MSKKPSPRRFLIDKRAARLAAASDDDDDRPLTTAEAADWLGVSTQFLEIARHRGDGPRYMRLGPRCIRYTIPWLREWCEQRAFTHTKQYTSAK
jgi:hypothetical protein